MPPASGQTTARSRRAARRTTRRRKPETPSAQALRSARAQQSAYVSQGRAVQRVANRQRAAQTVRRQQARSKPLAPTPIRHPRAGRPVRRQAQVNQVVAAVNRQSRSVAADRARAIRAVSRSGGEFPTFKHGEAYQQLNRAATRRLAQERAVAVAPAISLLNQTTRPIHGIAGAILAAQRGQNVARGGLRGLQLKDKALFSDVLKQAGLKGRGVGALGFALDVVADPTTWLSGGTAIPARAAAKQAALKATSRALKSGATKKVADRAGRAAARVALDTETNRGLTIGVGRRFRTSGRTTAKLDRALGFAGGAEKARGALPGRLVGHVSPSLRPAGVATHEWETVRAAARRERAAAAAGEKRVRNAAVALHRAVPAERHPAIIDAIESRDFTGLEPKEQQAAQFLSREFDRMYGAERSKNLIGAKLQEDFGYFPRRHLGELEPDTSKAGRRMSGANLESSMRRTERRPRSEFRGSEHDVYTENVPISYYLRGRASAVKLARKGTIDALAKVSRTFTPGQTLREGEAVYRFHPREVPQEVTGDKLKMLHRGAYARGGQERLNRLGPQVEKLASRRQALEKTVDQVRDAAAKQTVRNEIKRLAAREKRLSSQVDAIKSGEPNVEYRVLHKDLVRSAMPAGEKLKDLEEIGRIWDRQVQGRIKTLLTVPNPQYHFTNLYGDLFNAYLGSNIPRLAQSMGISTRALREKARHEAASRTLDKQIDPHGRGVTLDGKKLSYYDLIREAEDSGAIGQGFIGRDLPDVLEQQGRETAEAIGQGKVARRFGKTGRRVAGSRVGQVVGHPIQKIRDLSQYREDAVRLATYLGARKRGLSPDKASEWVARHHFDYGDLTTFERSVLRRVFPFYTFTARNTPLQARTLLTKPGKYANLEKVREEALKGSTVPEDYERRLRDYEQRGLPIPIPGMKGSGSNPLLLYPKLPATDLNRLSTKGQGQAILSMLTPILKAPTELSANYNFFFKDKIDKWIDTPGPNGEKVYQLKPAPKWVMRLPKDIRDSLHIQEYRNKDGQKLVGWPAKLDYVLKQSPLSGTALQFGTDTPNSRGQSAFLRGLGFATGLKVAPFEAPKRNEERLFNERAFLKAQQEAMRAQGGAYDANGGRTPAYAKILARSNQIDKALKVGPYKPKAGTKPTGVAADPGVQAARREAARSRQTAGRGILDDPEIQRVRRELARRP